MDSQTIRRKFLEFFESREHAVVASSSLIPTDPSVLLTTAGMQQFKPYYTGAADAQADFGSKNTVSIQKSFRTSDIDEVGDETHLTFFEMLGNFSFGYKPGEPVSPKGGYFKEEAIRLAHEFITKELSLPISYVTVFEGSESVPKDLESKQIWESLGVKDIREEGMEDVFWGPTGIAGPCGPTTEIYCRNAQGKDVEIWNVVFNQFFYPGTREELLSGTSDKKLEPLPTFGVDTGMGLERLAMIAQGKNNIFETDLFAPLMAHGRIVADHTRASCFLIADGVRPDNKGAGYILRRLMRRVLSKINVEDYKTLIDVVVREYSDHYSELKSPIKEIVIKEAEQFGAVLEQGLRELKKLRIIDTTTAFNLFQSYGLPVDVIKDNVPDFDQKTFEEEFKKHQDVSRAGVAGKFAGGLANHEPATIKLHTAHHLLLAALQQVLGKQVKQRGSNITQERLRLDFSYPEKLTDEQKKKVEEIVNEKIKADLPVIKKEMTKAEAEKLGAEHEFGAKYGDTVSVYFIGGESSDAFSKEFCGGPHVSSTGDLGNFKIFKEESVAAGIRRVKAVLEK